MLFKKNKKPKSDTKLRKTYLQTRACNQVFYSKTFAKKTSTRALLLGGSFSLRFKLIGTVAVPPPLNLRGELSHGCGGL